jgi:hypothetical protein
MGMQMRYNPSMLEARLNQIGDRAVKGVSDVMRRAAIRIRDLARAYAPVKTGLLERSIDYAVIRDDKRRNSYIVFIDLDEIKVNTKGNVKELGDYAFLMHEGLSPYGSGAFKLGKKSAAKRARGKKVGGRFLTRAAKDGLGDILGEAAKEVRRVTGSGASSVGVQYQRIDDDEDYE